MALVLLLFLAGGLGGYAYAEPYFAVRQGLKCAMCHENPTGGGLRTAFGNAWAQNILAERSIAGADAATWTGIVNRHVSLGADLRAQATYTEVPGSPSRDEFNVEELRVYLQLIAIPDRLSLNIDQRLAPGNSTNLEAYAKLRLQSGRWYAKAGRMYLPYGLRLEDDTALIRQVPGINFTTPDSGVEVGYESGAWSAQLAASNGSAGGPETDRGKQWSLKAEYVLPRWRAGVSANFNDSDAGDRRMHGLFVGLRTGPVAWLAEADHVVDSLAAGDRRQWVGLVEANWNFRRGHNLKLTAEALDPDTRVDEDEQSRFSVLWEYTPVQFLQLRAGARIYDGIPQNDQQNRRILLAELHAFF